jgi:hypothetical protein
MKPLTRLFSLALNVALFVTTGGLADTPAKSPAEPKDHTQSTKPTFAELPGVVVGVIVADINPLIAVEGRSGPPGAAGFAVGADGYRWFYLQSPEGAADTVKIGVGKGGAEKKSFPGVHIARAADLERLKITGKYTLAEVEVNGGLGSPAGADSFVVSKLRMLDGTSEYPLHVAEKVRELEKQFDGYEKEQAGLIDRTMKELAEQKLHGRPPTGPQESSRQVRVTWLPEKELLRVEFRTRVTNGDYKYSKGMERSIGPRPASPQPRPTGSRFGTMFGLELGVVYEVSKRGELEHTLPRESATFSRELPPPQASRR